MKTQSSKDRADVFWDGQNVFHSVKALFGYREPNFDIEKLSRLVCEKQGLRLGKIHFYTGMPSRTEAPSWHAFWERKLAVVGRQNQGNVSIFNPPLRYRDRVDVQPDGTTRTWRASFEKGVDVRLAIDMMRATYARHCSSMIVFSQDSDLAEAVSQVTEVARDQGRKMPVFSAYMVGDEGARYQRGINGTKWMSVTREEYDQCLDLRNYFKADVPVDLATAERQAQHRNAPNPIIDIGAAAHSPESQGPARCDEPGEAQRAIELQRAQAARRELEILQTELPAHSNHSHACGSAASM